MIETKFEKIYSDCYGIRIEKPLANVWYSPETNYYCVFEGHRPNDYDNYDCVSIYFSDYKNTKPLIKKPSGVHIFFFLCFLAKKDNCKAPDIMELLTPDLSSREKYIEQAKKIFKIRGYLGFHVVFGDGPSDCAYTSTFGEKVFRDDHVMFVDKYDDYYECSVYMERGGEKRAVAIIYDESLLYPHLLNEQFYLLFDRANGRWDVKTTVSK